MTCSPRHGRLQLRAGLPALLLKFCTQPARADHSPSRADTPTCDLTGTLACPAGETLPQVLRRVLGPDLSARVPLFTKNTGFATLNVRGDCAPSNARNSPSSSKTSSTRTSARWARALTPPA